MAEEKPFSFGENWQSYLEDIDEERIAAARESLQRHFGVEDFSGSRFIDVGCGSGLFSLAALQLDAAEVISFDYDGAAVAGARELYQKAGEPDHWSLSQGDMLNDDFIDSLPEADYVYAWGSVHYTGSLWEAIDNTLSLVSSDGVVFMTIWNRVIARELSTGKLKSTDWEKIKYAYHHAPSPVKTVMVKGYLYLWMLLQYKRGSSPAEKRKEKKQNRGMSVEEDIRMWLGGLPYDYATVGEVCEHVLQNHSFVAEYVDENERFGNNLYRFRRGS